MQKGFVICEARRLWFMSPRGPILLKALFTGTLPQDGLAGDEDAKGEQQIATSWLFSIGCSAATMNRFWYLFIANHREHG